MYKFVYFEILIFVYFHLNIYTIYEKNLSDLDLEIISIKTQAEEEIGLFDDLFSKKEIKLDENIVQKYIERIDVYNNETIKISLKGFLGGREMSLSE